MDERDIDALIYHLRLRSVPGAFKAEQHARWLNAIAALRARAEQAEADAERYRWLRNWPDNDYDDLFVCANRPGPDPHGAELDAEIDAAIDRARSQGEGAT